jgi:hypothetical protein
MTVWLAERRILLAPVVAATGLTLGLVAGAQPRLALAAGAAGAIILLAFRAPVANLVLLLLLTCVVPYGVQNEFSVGGGGPDAPGLFLSDLVLTAGLGSALVILVQQELDWRRFAYAAAIAVFLAVAVLQFGHGVLAGSDLSRAGFELRILFGLGSFVIALPLLADQTARRRLLVSLAGVGIVLGAWGMLQWFGRFDYGGDVGVRPGVLHTTAGTGQLQGGEFGYPAAIALFFAVLASGSVRSLALRLALALGLVLNAAACFVTFERSFWIGALLGAGIALLGTARSQRLKVALALPVVAVAAIGALAVFGPSQLRTAEERALSLGQASEDESVRYRLVESRFVLDRIGAHPVTGSGLGATIYWGRPWQQVAPKSYAFSHNGYLWVAWKLGVPAAILLVALIGCAVVLRGPPADDRLARAVRYGSRGALAGLLLATVTFSTFNELNITSAIGVLLALALCPVPAYDRRVE